MPSSVVAKIDVDHGPGAILLNERIFIEYFVNFLKPPIIDFVVAQPCTVIVLLTVRLLAL